MWKRMTILALIALLLTMAVATAVSADSVIGSGWLEADGDGRACMTGNAETLLLSGQGVVWYFDAGEVDEPVITGQGVRRDFASGWVRWKGFDGTFTLSDADEIIVCLRGKDIHMHVAGTGAVKLTGKGHYETGAEDVPTIDGLWTATGRVIEFGQ